MVSKRKQVLRLGGSSNGTIQPLQPFLALLECREMAPARHRHMHVVKAQVGKTNRKPPIGPRTRRGNSTYKENGMCHEEEKGFPMAESLKKHVKVRDSLGW